MTGFDVIGYSSSRKYTEDTIEGAGAVAGKPCQIQSIVDEDNKHIVTFLWIDNAGTSHTSTMTVLDGVKGDKGDTGEDGKPGTNGVSITDIEADGNTLIITLSDGTVTEIELPIIEASSLDNLSDVEIDRETLLDGNVLVYDAELGKFVNAEGSGGDATLENDVTSNLTVGAIASGTTLERGTTFTEFAQKLLITEIAPTTTFSASGSGVKEVGTSVTPTLTLTINNKGTGTPTAIKFYNGSTLLDTQDYVDGTNTYTFTMESAVTTTTTVKGVLEYKKSNQSTASIEKTATYTFVMASYYGPVNVAPTTKAEIIALTKNVKTGKGQTATFNLSNQRSCYAYPASMGNLTSIKDANNFEYLSSYTKTTVVIDDVNYNVYTLTDPVTATGFKQVYA